jgi:hypothetical protein
MYKYAVKVIDGISNEWIYAIFYNDKPTEESLNRFKIKYQWNLKMGVDNINELSYTILNENDEVFEKYKNDIYDNFKCYLVIPNMEEIKRNRDTNGFSGFYRITDKNTHKVLYKYHYDKDNPSFDIDIIKKKLDITPEIADNLEWNTVYVKKFECIM